MAKGFVTAGPASGCKYTPSAPYGADRKQTVHAAMYAPLAYVMTCPSRSRKHWGLRIALWADGSVS